MCRWKCDEIAESGAAGGERSEPPCCLYIKILVVRPSVTGGQRKQFDLKKQEVVSLAIEQQRLQLDDLCERQLWH